MRTGSDRLTGCYHAVHMGLRASERLLRVGGLLYGKHIRPCWNLAICHAQRLDAIRNLYPKNQAQVIIQIEAATCTWLGSDTLL